MENTNYWNWSPMCTQNHIQKSKDVDGSRLDQSTPILSVNASHVKNCTVQGAWNRFNSLCPFLKANVKSSSMERRQTGPHGSVIAWSQFLLHHNQTWQSIPAAELFFSLAKPKRGHDVTWSLFLKFSPPSVPEWLVSLENFPYVCSFLKSCSCMRSSFMHWLPRFRIPWITVLIANVSVSRYLGNTLLVFLFCFLNMALHLWSMNRVSGRWIGSKFIYFGT